LVDDALLPCTYPIRSWRISNGLLRDRGREFLFRKIQLLLLLLPFGGSMLLVVALGLVVAAVVVMRCRLPRCKREKNGRQRRRDRRGRLGGNSSFSTSQPTRRHRMCTANYLRPLDEIICLSKRQINTKPNYPAKGSALFASCARPVRLFLRIKFSITLFSFFLSVFLFSFLVRLFFFFFCFYTWLPSFFGEAFFLYVPNTSLSMLLVHKSRRTSSRLFSLSFQSLFPSLLEYNERFQRMINETLFFHCFSLAFSQRILMKFHDCCVELSLCYDIDNTFDPRPFSSSSSSSGVLSLLYVLLLAAKGYMRSLNELFMRRLVYISFCFLSHHLFFHIFYSFFVLLLSPFDYL
jgi:hypothetical protein